MLKYYYQRQLDHLRELAEEFSRAHPSLAPMLAGQSRDPDVERLLEGMAYLTGMLSARLDDSFPEIVHNLLHLCAPQCLRPIPSATIIRFIPREKLVERFLIRAETQLMSVPVSGIKCIYSTCFDVDVVPLRLEDVRFEQRAGDVGKIFLFFSLSSVENHEDFPEYIRLYLGESYIHSSLLFFLLTHQVKNIRIFSPESLVELDSNAIRPSFFNLEYPLFPYPRNSFAAFRLFQEYFILPEKFLFIDIYGWKKWIKEGGRGNFVVEIIFKSHLDISPNLNLNSFIPFCTPAINLFPHDATPIYLSHHSQEYRIFPAGEYGKIFQIFDITSVTGIKQGSIHKRKFLSMEKMKVERDQEGLYYKKIKYSDISEEPEWYVSIGYEDENELEKQVLMIELLCNNGKVVNSLQVGDICNPTDTSPLMCSFKNLTFPTPNYNPILDKDNLWRFLSHFNINIFSFNDVSQLKELIKLYLSFQKKDVKRYQANLKRIEGILDMKIRKGRRLYKGYMLPGHDIFLEMSSDYFTNLGDMFIFVKILDYFFCYYSSLNSYTRLIVKDQKTGEELRCPARFGVQHLI